MTAAVVCSRVGNFLTDAEIDFVTRHNFALEEHIDDNVIRYGGTHLTRKATELLSSRFGDAPIAIVNINFNDNSDIGLPRTYCVEIGIERECGAQHGFATFGIFGRSSNTCPCIETAFQEAAAQLLVRLLVTAKGGTVAFHRRLL